MILQYPWVLLTLVLLPLIWWRWLSHKPHAAVRFSSTKWLKTHGGGFRVKARHALPFLRTLAMGLLILCLARPQKDEEETRIFSEGIAIQMVVDRSISMEAEDFSIDGRRVNRLEAVKRVFKDFVVGDDDLKGRPDDLIGMIAFAGYADSVCPMTLDHAFLIDTLNDTEIVDRRRDNGTAIGEAVALAAERLHDLDRQKIKDETRKIKSKVIILLTDGESNRGEIEPKQAAEIARTFDIKIYAIGAGSTSPNAGSQGRRGFGSFGNRYSPIDEATLKSMADTTGGKYWRATDTKSLREIYAEIGELEKSATEEKQYEQWSEIATEGVQLGSIHVPSLLGIVLTLIVMEVILANTRLRKIP